MLRLFFVMIFLPSAGSCFSQAKKKNPPGTVRVNDTLYIDKTEVANIHWREYLFYLQRVDSANAFVALPDTLVWKEESTYNEPFQEYYFRHPGFNFYPVVGISYEQAQAFCQWRTFFVNLGFYLKENNYKDWEQHINDSFPIRLYYRLPTEAEWETIASGTFPVDTNPYGRDSTYKKWKKNYVRTFNCIYPGVEPVLSHSGERKYYTAPVKSYWHNSSGVYNMIGNVAEMVLEKGVAKGGSFDHRLEECKIRAGQRYTAPKSWLGFRCVAVMVR